MDRTTAPSFRSVHLADTRRAEIACARHENGACAAMIGSAARIGEQTAALRFAAANYDAAATEGWLPARCSARAAGGSCPDGSEQLPDDLAEALDWFLQDHGYVHEPITQTRMPGTVVEAGAAPTDYSLPDNSTEAED